jgi:hypothetical protein
MSRRADHFVSRVAEQLGEAAVDVEDPPVAGDDRIGTRGVLVVVLISGLAFAEAALGAQPLELGRRAGGEDPQDE